MRWFFVTIIMVAGCGDNAGVPDGGLPFWLESPQVLVPGVGVKNLTCTDAVCPHNENTDLLKHDGTIYFVHRTATSQILGPNSSLRFYRSTDDGASFQLQAIIPAPTAATYPALGDRDIRDPSLFIVHGQLTMKALLRLPVTSMRDSDVDTTTVTMTSADDGVTWSPFQPIAPGGWSFWRVKQDANGVYYSAAYQDGDLAVKLFTSPDGVTWTAGAMIYDVSDDTPLETELVFMPSGRLLALVRMDGTTDELIGNNGRLRTKVCWASPPYASFACPQELTGVRLDGPVAFFHESRLFVIARKNFIDSGDRKRTALFELGGTLDGGPLTITDLGSFPSSGDTSYAGVADLDDVHTLAVWYSSDVTRDQPWILALYLPSDIWRATIDFTHL